ncbi:hypothetical protein CHH83_25235 [Bacillus sp. 7586-K]|nr:hypothetical protein CHH83_25235 [Bacillus sp. 7586-K]
MKRDLKINYGILDGIIEQLHTYKNALDTMHSSLETLVSFIRNNYADSIDAWDDVVKDSKKHIKDYQGQIGDLLSLFEGYVDDTTAYITPLARNSMMRVDRNDIWANLCQVESGVTNNVPKAINITYNTPFSFAFWDDPTDEEKERSRANKEKLEYIRGEIKASKSILEGKVDALWNLYDNKIVPFENTDDAYNNKAADVKDKYTDFFEGVVDVLSGIGDAVSSFVEGLVDGIIDIVVGLVTIIVEAGIVAVSNQIPDFVEPDILKDKANEIKDKYSEMVVNAVEDPFSILESLGQGVTDTAEEEGIMYIAGNVSTSFIPYVGVLGKAKWLKAVDNGNGPKTKPVSDGIQAKVKDLVNNNKAFEGIKNGAIEFVSGVRNGANIFINGLLRPNIINDRLAPVGVPSGINVPWNVLDNKTIQDHIVAPLKMAIDRVNGGGKGERDVNKGTSETYTGGRTVEELDSLSYDPAKKAVTEGSKQEAAIGLELEQKGKFGRIERSLDPKAEFIDITNGKKIDVKSFESYPIGSDGKPITSPRKGAFKVENAMKNIIKEFDKNGNDIVVIDKSKLELKHIKELEEAIKQAGLDNKIIWWPE